MLRATAENIHAFWFAGAAADADKAAERMRFWFAPDAHTDRIIADRYAGVVDDAAQGRYADWESQPRTCVALVVVLDQFPRNLHRGTPAAFDHDARALDVSRRAIAAGHPAALTPVERGFLMMPFQHCEALACQHEGVALFQAIHDSASAQWRPVTRSMLHYARLHRDIIERFGRFPHRNAILGRDSTPAETEYLASGAESFGQTRR